MGFKQKLARIVHDFVQENIVKGNPIKRVLPQILMSREILR